MLLKMGSLERDRVGEGSGWGAGRGTVTMDVVTTNPHYSMEYRPPPAPPHMFHLTEPPPSIPSYINTTEFSAQQVFETYYSIDTTTVDDGSKMISSVEYPNFDTMNFGVHLNITSGSGGGHGVFVSSQGSNNDEMLVDVYAKKKEGEGAVKKIENDRCVNGEGNETVLIFDPGGGGHQKGTNVSNGVAASDGAVSDSQISTKKVGLTARWGSTFWKDCHHMCPDFESGTESKFESKLGRLPVAGSEEDADKLVSIAGKINETLRHDKLDDINSKLLHHSAFGARAVLNPMAAMFGGIVGQEVRKACSGKFHPLFQFFYFDSIESLPTEQLDLNDFRPLNSRYDAQISVLGAKLQKKLEDAQVFVVGSGALGCEFLKNLALMGVSCSSQGKLTVTDDDVIEKSNLSRQLLFRDWNIGHAKSSVAATAAALINPNRNIKALQNRVGPETENVLVLKQVLPDNWVVNMLAKAEELYELYKLKDMPNIEQWCSCSNLSCDNIAKGNIIQAASRDNSDDNYLYSPSAVDIQAGDLKHFQAHWSKGEPVIVSNVLNTTYGLSWEPEVISRAIQEMKSQPVDVIALNCFDWCEVKLNIKKLFKGYKEGLFDKSDWPQMLKLKVQQCAICQQNKSSQLSQLNAELELLVEPEELLEVREVKEGKKTRMEALIKWKDLPSTEATWEDVNTVSNQFPAFHLEDKVVVWGGGNVMHQDEARPQLTYSRKKVKGKKIIAPEELKSKE